MVLLHALEQGVALPRVSKDIDAAVDIRARPRALREVVGCLGALGFESAASSRDGHAHRFERFGEGGRILVDMLVPEGLGPRADTVTVPPGRAFPAAGVSQALTRTELVPVRQDARDEWVPRPSLLGALVAKATAAAVDSEAPERHLRDVAFLCGLLEDPFAVVDELTTTDRRRLSAVSRLLDKRHEHWSAALQPTVATTALRALLGAGR